MLGLDRPQIDPGALTVAASKIEGPASDESQEKALNTPDAQRRTCGSAPINLHMTEDWYGKLDVNLQPLGYEPTRVDVLFLRELHR